MKLLVVSNGYPPHGRFGTEFYTHQLVRGLKARGHELCVLHPDRSGSRPRYTLERDERDGVEVLRLHNPGGGASFASSYRDAEVERVVSELLAGMRPDLVHFTYLLWGLSVELPRIAAEAGAATTVTLTDYGLVCHRGQMFDHTLADCGGPHAPAVCARCIRTPAPYDLAPWPRRLKTTLAAVGAAAGGLGRIVVAADVAAREAAVRAMLPHVGRWIAPTHNLGQVFVGAGVPRERLDELVYAFDETGYRPDPARRPTRRLGFFGQFAPHKGLGTLIEATRLLVARGTTDFELVLHGAAPGGRHRLYADAVLARKPAQVVRGAGFEPDQAAGILHGLDALLVPSQWHENAPLAVLQARAAGVWVVGSDVPGIREVVDEGVQGTLVPPRDAARWAAAMQAVLDEAPEVRAPGLPLGLEAHLDRITTIHAAALAARKERTRA